MIPAILPIILSTLLIWINDYLLMKSSLHLQY